MNIIKSIWNFINGKTKDYNYKIQETIYNNIGIYYTIGLRKYQEDRYNIQKIIGTSKNNFTYILVVLDGHGGSLAVDYVNFRLIDYIINDADFFNDPIKTYKNTIYKLDQEYLEFTKDILDESGTTITICSIIHNTIYIANSGDSLGYLIKNNLEFLSLTETHRASNIDEANRIRNSGGFILAENGKISRARVDGKISITRSIGDKKLKKYIISTPYCNTRLISSNDMLIILGTDGIWDYLSIDEIKETILKYFNSSGI